MAGIFDKKQEVLDFIMTREGQRLYRDGKFKPAFYEFYDSDIVYEANNSEEQNASLTRIMNGLYQKAINGIDTINAIGGSTGPIPNAPAWQVNFEEGEYSTGSFSTTQKDVYKSDLDGENTTVAGTLKGVNTYEERIPQFNVNVKYRLYQNEIQLTNGVRYELYLDDRNEDILVSIGEKNAFELNESPEFEIEVFEIIEPEGSETSYTLERRYFDFENFEDKTSVEKYFNILFDEETRFESNFKKKNIYKDILSDPEEACEPEATTIGAPAPANTPANTGEISAEDKQKALKLLT